MGERSERGSCCCFVRFLFTLSMSEIRRVALYNLPEDVRKEILELSAVPKKEDGAPPAAELEDSLDAFSKKKALVHFSCSLCNLTFSSLEEQRKHFHSETHLQKLRSQYSDDSDEEDDEDSNGEEKEKEEGEEVSYTEEGSLLTLSLSSNRLTLYKRLVESGMNDKELNLSQLGSHLDGHFCLLLYRSGYFIMGIYDHGKLLITRQEKRYTTRRKQGGAQRKKDNTTGKARSMGARLRRHNEALMEEFVRKTLRENKEEIMKCSAVFIGTTKFNL